MAMVGEARDVIDQLFIQRKISKVRYLALRKLKTRNTVTKPGGRYEEIAGKRALFATVQQHKHSRPR